MSFSALLLFAAVSDPSAAAPMVQAETKKERQICRRIETSESRLGAKRLCKTAAEWREEDSGSVEFGVVKGAARGAN